MGRSSLIYWLIFMLVGSSLPTGAVPAERVLNYYGESALSLVPGHPGTLYPFWAQYMIGADLVPEALEGWDDELVEVPIGVADRAFLPEFLTGNISEDAALPYRESPENNLRRYGGSHGTAGVNLMNGKSPIGVAVSARVVALATTIRETDLNPAKVLFEKKAPRLVNLSLVPTSEMAADYVKDLGERFFVVTAAGNDYPDRRFAEGRVFVVGSMGPTGFATTTSQEESLLWAPADFYIKSKLSFAPFGNFAETSAAAYLVTGALANILAIIPEMTFDELKSILLGTLVKTANSFQKSHRNGHGMVNALKMVEVAKRLKRSGWPNDRENLISDPTLFDFQAEAREEIRLARGSISVGTPAALRSSFRQVRRAFLLDDANEEARIMSQQSFSNEGLRTNAEFYRSVRSSELRELLVEKLNNPDLDGPTMAEAAARTAGMLPLDDAIPLLSSGLHSNLPRVRAQSALALRDLGADGLDLLKIAMNDENDLVRAAVCRTILFLFENGVPVQRLGKQGTDYLDKHIRTFSDAEFTRAIDMLHVLRREER